MSSIDIYTHPYYTTLRDACKQDAFDEYIKLCVRYANNRKAKRQTEAHHIFPVSIFGQNDTLINLPIKEHFSAHVLLWKAIDGTKSELHMKWFRKMANAVHKMVQGRNHTTYTPEEYEQARLAVIDARTNTVTAYDVREDKYVKVNKNQVDSKRYFTVFPVINTITGKRTYVSVIDPQWVDCIHAGNVQKYLDLQTNTHVNLDTSYAKNFPERYVHWRKGTKPTKSQKGKARRFYDPVTKQYVSCTTPEGRRLGYEGCSNYIDLDNENKIVYIASSVAKEQPWRYKHANAGRFDVIDIDTGECIKIYAHEYDKTKYIARSKLIHEKSKISATQTLDFGE
jgi:hypothetical protein